jgi:hypothetical protein
MNDETFMPPLRDLPPGRLAQRTHHLRAEIAGRQRPAVAVHGRSRELVLAALALALAAVLLATPAFGLRDQIVHLFSGDKQQRPPEPIQRFFRNMYVTPPGTEVIPGRARVAVRVSVPGYGHKVLWVAPTRAGGYCSTAGCNGDRSARFGATMQIAGPTSRSAALGSSNVHVFFLGDTIIRGAAVVAMRFEDGSSERTRLVRVPKPIDAGFFIYVLPKAHWKVGERPVALAVEDAKGNELARNTTIGRYFRDAQRHGLALPPATRWYTSRPAILLAAIAILAAVGLLWRLRRQIEALIDGARKRVRRRPPMYGVAALVVAIAGGVVAAIALTGGLGSTTARPQLEFAKARGNVVSHPYAFGYVKEGFLGSPSRRDRVLMARTPEQGLRWDRWITHHRVSPPQSADFAHQALIGVFLLGHPSYNTPHPSHVTQGVSVTSLALRGGTLRLSFQVSPRPIAFCGPGPDSPTECRPMYRAHSERYHAFTIISVPRSVAARVRRVVVTGEGYHPGEILVRAPASAINF